MGGGVILPEPGKCIYVFDEAHHLPVKANNHFSETSSIRRTQHWIEGLRKELSQLRSSELVTEEESVTIIKILDSLGKHFEQTFPALQQVLTSQPTKLSSSESLETLPILNEARIHSSELAKMTVGEIYAKIVEAIELPVA